MEGVALWRRNYLGTVAIQTREMQHLLFGAVNVTLYEKRGYTQQKSYDKVRRTFELKFHTSADSGASDCHKERNRKVFIDWFEMILCKPAPGSVTAKQ